MGYLKYTQYIYIIIALFFAYDAIMKLNEGDESYPFYFAIAGMATFMFFFRRRFINKHNNRNKNQ
ncbi:hypothetical protein P0R33_10710 [Flavobacterium sp. YJ01]|uniref:hypothetical protein n=1 Tax=Flavobacterium sp. YJ01 TaxID=3031997 RepID=UPI0023E38979|nr:hypothetical protein [Flavobacterium sp. YJ01]WET04790.1 hypothetical protein P0R33_10710 [Flavobacterium sp. YJ01]